MYDVFICYNWDDKDWADALHAALVDRGLLVFQDDKSIPFGDTLDPALRSALLGSRMLVPLMTPTFHESPSCRKELLTALTAAYRLEKGFTERVMPITWRVRPSALRPRQLKRPKLLTRERHDVAAQAAIIAEKIARITVTDERRFGDAPEAGEPEWYPRGVPGNKRFLGRGELMWELHESLRVKRKPGNRGHPVVSVRGEGGQGKTSLCEQYARLFAEDHPGGVFVFRLGGSDRRGRLDAVTVLSRFHQQLREMASMLGVKPRSGATSELVAAVGRRLRKGEPYLWLVDDVPSTVDLNMLEMMYAPTGNGRTILTSRGELAGVVSDELVLEPLDERSCLEVLTAARELDKGASPERSAARGIVADLGRNALGLTIAAGLTRRPEFQGYQELRSELGRSTPDSLEMAEHLTDVPLAHRKAFSTTLMRSFQALPFSGRELLAVSSVLGDAPLPPDLVEEVVEKLGRRADVAGFDTLVAHGLATRLDDGAHRVHALIARAARFFFPVEQRRRLHEAAAEVIGDSLEAARDRFDVTRSLSSRLPHTLALASAAEWPPGRSVWRALNESGRAQYELGDTVGSLYSLELLHKFCEESGADDETRLVALVSLAAAHYGQGNYARARDLQEESVARSSALHGLVHDTTLQARENLANTLGNLGAFEEALNLHRAVYDDRCRLDGHTARKTLVALNNLVLAVGRCGSPRLALRMALGAWARWQRAAGPDLPETLESVEAIGHNQLRLGSARDAADTHDYVAGRRRAVLGPDHPDTIDAMENAAMAREFTLWKIYAERLRVQGPAHLDTMQTLRRLLIANLRGSSATVGDPVDTTTEALPEGVTDVRLDGEHAELLAEIVELAVALSDQESAHGAETPPALRANVVLAHALGAADQLDGQIEAAVAIVQDARDGLAEAAARAPRTVEQVDLDIAEVIHHWLLELEGEDPDY